MVMQAQQANVRASLHRNTAMIAFHGPLPSICLTTSTCHCVLPLLLLLLLLLLVRRRHQAAPLAWDASMAAQAAEFAAGCPMGRSGKAGLGESLAFGYPDAASAVDACELLLHCTGP
jgi:hypothetical protein